MPTRGLWPSRRFLIGSATAKVLHDATYAVWTNPHPQELPQFAGFHQLSCTIARNEIIPEFLKEVVRPASCREQVELCHRIPVPRASRAMKEKFELEKNIPCLA
jgi:hypothetical protein